MNIEIGETYRLKNSKIEYKFTPFELTATNVHFKVERSNGSHFNDHMPIDWFKENTEIIDFEEIAENYAI